ncbi:MAG: SDR family oxidoreductase, partial [Pedobacter sp.]
GIPVLIDINEDAVTQFAQELANDYGVASSGFAVDITIETEIEDNCAILVGKYGHIDGLINNAANNPKMEDSTGRNFSRLENFPVPVWDADLAVGLKGAFLCAKYYGYAISKQGGSIINISSDLGLISPDQRLYRKDGLSESQQPVKPVTYSVVKSGLIGLTKYLSTYWAKDNVRCNAICPGGVETEQDPEFIKDLCERIPMGRMANKSEYQGTILYLLSNASSYMTGAVISVDGGRTAW